MPTTNLEVPVARVPRLHFRPPLGGFDHDAQLRDVALRLLASAIGISPSDRQFLQDVARGRYSMRSQRRLNAIAARSVRFEDREAPAELVRADIFAQTARIGCLYTVHDVENAANSRFDLAQYQLERAYRTNSLTPTLVDDYRRAGLAQLATTREAIDLADSLTKVS